MPTSGVGSPTNFILGPINPIQFEDPTGDMAPPNATGRFSQRFNERFGDGAISSSVGTADGVGTAAAVGQSIVAGVGTAAGVGDAPAVGVQPASTAVGTANGVGAAAGVGISIAAAVGTSAGVGAAAGAGNAQLNTVGTSAGVGAAAAVGAPLANGVGTAAGIGAASAIGLAATVGSGVGTAAGVGAASAVGISTTIVAGVGSAFGVGAATALGVSAASTAGTAAGVGAAPAVGVTARRTVGTSAGVGAASGVGAFLATRTGVGTAAGVGAASGQGVAAGTPATVYNIHLGLPAWASGSATLGQRVSNAGNAYQCITAGTTTVAPTGTAADSAPGGTAHWKWLSAIDFTSVSAFNAAMPATQVNNLVVYLWPDGGEVVLPSGRAIEYYGHSAGAYSTLFTTPLGESFRDFPTSPVGGLSFRQTTANTDFGIYCDVANVTIDGIKFKNDNLTSGGQMLIQNVNAANFTLSNFSIDCAARAGDIEILYSQCVNTRFLNGTINDGQATGIPQAEAIKFDNPPCTGVVENVTMVARNGANPNGVAIKALGGAGQVIIRNCAFFGYTYPFVDQNAPLANGFDHCLMDVPVTSTRNVSGITFGASDNGGNLFSKIAANQFINAFADLRLKPGADAVGAAAVDLTYIPDGLDLYRVARGATPDIGAVEIVAIVTGVGVANGIGAATAVGASLRAGVGIAAGVGASLATGVPPANVGTAAGVGAATAVGASLRRGVGTAAGVGAASGVGSGPVTGVGTAAGVGAALAVGRRAIVTAGVGTSNGVGAAFAVGGQALGSFGTAAGVGAAHGVGVPVGVVAGVGRAAGLGAARGVGAFDDTHLVDEGLTFVPLPPIPPNLEGLTFA